MCVINYIYPAVCGSKAHGSSSRLFYISISCPQTGLAGHSRVPQPPKGKDKRKNKGKNKGNRTRENSHQKKKEQRKDEGKKKRVCKEIRRENRMRALTGGGSMLRRLGRAKVPPLGTRPTFCAECASWIICMLFACLCVDSACLISAAVYAYFLYERGFHL